MNKIQDNKQDLILGSKLILIMVVFILVTIPEIASAATASYPWDGPLQNVINILTGTTARLLAILLFMVCGFMVMNYHLRWDYAVAIVGCTFLVFSGAWIIEIFLHLN